MLKKLVKYGNSNALVLDKAILELLNIPEGAVLKIKTDGKSIILTPHQEHAPAQEVTPTVTAQEILQRAAIQERLKQFTHLDETQRFALGQKLYTLYAKQTELYEKLSHNTRYQAAVQDALARGAAKDHQAWAIEHEAIVAQCLPEMEQVKKDIENFEAEHNLTLTPRSQVSYQDKAAMQKEFADIFKKHNPANFGQILQSPEYQHEAQLIAEKYQNNLNSTECLAEMNQLMYKFCPEMELVHKEIAIVNQKYGNV